MKKINQKNYGETLIEKIRKRQAKLAIIGAGYVGLPTVALFAEAGFPAIAIDIRPELINGLNKGCVDTNEPGLNDLVHRNVLNGRLKGYLVRQLDFKQVDVILIAVQTPIGENNEPCLRYLMKVLETVGKTMQRGTLVVLISTIPPGTTLNEVKPNLESLSNLEVERDFYLAYVPERIAPGKAITEFVEGTRLIGGVGQNSTNIASELFAAICKNLIKTNATTAEIAKLAENTFRDLNIAFANELALICEQLGADVENVIKLANTHPRVKIHVPGPGVGGPCLPKDPYFLINSLVMPCDIIRAARKLNDYMSEHIIQIIKNALNFVEKDISTSKIAILGTAYKRDTDDSRLSPAYPIIAKLLDLGAQVNVYDSWCKESFGAKRKDSLKEAVEGADCLVTITDHTELIDMNLEEIKLLMNCKPIIVDGRRIINPKDAKTLGFFYHGIGYGDFT